jgi:TolB-like protein/cytochrome c-type biogenesis protein CcmH/NrfG
MASSVPKGLGWQTARPASGLPNECSIALLPLHNLCGAPEDEPLCAGITGDIIHNLTRFRDLTVIAQHSALQINALSLPSRRVAERLGVRYLLLGDLERMGDGLKVHARLLHADSEQVVWSVEFDGPLGDVFAFQDEVSEIVVANLAAEIRAAEMRRAVDSAPAELSAYGLVLRGQFLTHQYRRAANWQARLLFERARRIDPGYGRSHAALSRTFNLDWRYAWSDDPSAALDRAAELAELAIQCDPFDARGHAEMGFVCLYRKHHQASLEVYERAIELNPNDADILAEMGDALTNTGQHERAMQSLARAMDLNPLYPDWYLWLLGGVYFNIGDYQRAIDTLEGMRDLSEARRLLASSYAHLGRMPEARQHAAQLMEVHPNFSIEHWRTVPPLKDQEPLERLIEGMRKAGLK